MTSRARLAGAGRKPPQAASVKSPGRERHGKGALEASGVDQRRRTTVNCRSSVESTQMTSKPGSDVAPRLVWPLPAYGSGGVRHRGSVSLIRALTLNCGNLRWRCKAKGTSPKGEADSSDVPPRDGAARSSVEATVMAVERRGCVIPAFGCVNRASGRSAAQ